MKCVNVISTKNTMQPGFPIFLKMEITQKWNYTIFFMEIEAHKIEGQVSSGLSLLIVDETSFYVPFMIIFGKRA